ncbi:hypothetical protein Tco_0456170 [Tanacetum coccineum]
MSRLRNKHIANLKGKNVVDSVQTVHNSNVVTSKVYKLDLQPLSPRIKNNRDAHVDYLKVTQEDTDTLQGIVEQAKALKPLDNALDYALRESVPMPLITVLVVMKPVQSMSSLMTPVRRYGNLASGYESYMLAVHSEMSNSTQRNMPKPLRERGPPNPIVV